MTYLPRRSCVFVNAESPRIESELTSVIHTHTCNAVTDFEGCLSIKVLPTGVADVARLQVDPQELPKSGEAFALLA